MRIFQISIALIILIVLLSIAHADIDDNYKYVVSDSIKTVSDSDGLRKFIYSDNTNERIQACIRLGEVADKSSLDLLIEAFDKEPYRSGNEVGKGVKYYSLVSIGKIGRQKAEGFLINIIQQYSKQEYSFWGSADTLNTIKGALEGLYELASNSAVAFFDSTFKNETYYWLIRETAHIYLVQSYLRSDAFRTASDSASYLINELYKVIGNDKMWTEDGKINVNFITSGSYGFLLFQYGKSIFPYLSDYISGLALDNPKRTVLERLKNNIKDNLPK